MLYPTDSPVSHAAPKVAAKKPSSTKASPMLPSATPTGRPICPRVPTSMPCDEYATAATPAIARDNSPPSGKPTKTLARIVPMSIAVHRSSTPPEEKKKTSYGVMAAPNSAMA